VGVDLGHLVICTLEAVITAEVPLEQNGLVVVVDHLHISHQLSADEDIAKGYLVVFYHNLLELLGF
jgi:hypothetical protein